MHCVDIGIPANNKGKHSIGCLFWLLVCMVLQMRGLILPGHAWDVMVDLFFYREPEEAKRLEQEVPVIDCVADCSTAIVPVANIGWDDASIQEPAAVVGINTIAVVNSSCRCWGKF